MKRVAAVLTALVLVAAVASVVFARGAAEREFVRIATAGTGGNMYRIGAGMASIWNDEIEGVTFSTQSTGGSPHNAELMATGQVEVAFIGAEIAEQAFLGFGRFEGEDPEKYSNINYLVYVYPNFHAMIVHPNAADEIQSEYDLEGKVVSKGLLGSQGEAWWFHMVETLGLNLDTIVMEDTVHGEAIDQMRDGIIDATYWQDGYGSPSHFEMLEMGAQLRSLHPDAIEAFTTGNFHMNEPYTLPAGTYPNQPEAVTGVISPIIMIVRSDVDEDLVYQMTKALYENQRALASIAGLLADFMTLDDAGIGKVVPVHPGAARYYEEHGVTLERLVHPAFR